MSRARIVVFHRAVGFVHRSIPDAVAAIERLGAAHDLDVVATDDPDALATHLTAIDPGDEIGAAVFVHTSGDVLPADGQRRALEAFVRRGGGFFGIHAASSMGGEEPGSVRATWPWFRELVGAAFVGHTAARAWCDRPVEQRPGLVHAGPLADAPADAEWLGRELAITTWEPATVRVEDPACPAAAGLVDGATVADEWYGFDRNPRPQVRVVATVDESTYEPALGAMGADHPVVWWRPFDGGRSVYNALGHASSTWADPAFLAGVLGGIELAAGLTPSV